MRGTGHCSRTECVVVYVLKVFNPGMSKRKGIVDVHSENKEQERHNKQSDGSKPEHTADRFFGELPLAARLKEQQRNSEGTDDKCQKVKGDRHEISASFNVDCVKDPRIIKLRDVEKFG